MRRVMVRCDAGPMVGVGHVMRCVGLAESLKRRGSEVVFVADLDSVPWARSQVLRRGFAYRPVPSSYDETNVLAELDPWLVVVDSYLLPPQVYADLRRSDAVVLALVDGDPGNREADLFLDQNIGAERDAWPVPEVALRLAGLEFALLRDDVVAHRPSQPRVDNSVVPSVFAFFGGTDPFGAAPAVARLLIASECAFEATFVAARPEVARELGRIGRGPNQRLLVTPPVDDLPSRVSAADVVLSAAGSSSWELLCLGAAAGVLCVADNQEQAYGRVLDQDLAVGLGHLEGLQTGRPTPSADLVSLLTSAGRRATLRSRGWGLVDGRGRDRVIDAAERLLGAPPTV